LRSDTYSVSDLFVPRDYSVVPRVSARDHNLPEGALAEPEPERRESGILYRHSMQLVASCDLFREAGATAIFRSNPFERRFRDVHTVSIQVQGSIARMQSAGQARLGLTPQQLILIP
jgi:Acyl-CoA dehydrogenase, C-terminal domain